MALAETRPQRRRTCALQKVTATGLDAGLSRPPSSNDEGWGPGIGLEQMPDRGGDDPAACEVVRFTTREGQLT